MEEVKIVTVGDAWSLYELAILSSLKRKSQKIERRRWEMHLKNSHSLSEKKIEKLTSLDYLLLKKELENKKLSPQTVYHCLSLLRRILNKAAEWNPCQHISIPSFKGVMPKFDNKRTRFLSEKEFCFLLNILKKKSEYWTDIALFAVSTGLRKEEIFDLEFQNIHLSSNSFSFINVVDTKSSRNRAVPLNEIALSVVMKHQKREHAPFEKVFYGRNSKKFCAAVKESGLNDGIKDSRQKIVFHSLRHTFASWLVESGVPLAHVSKLLGHSSLNVTMRYAHLAPSPAIYAVDVISKKLLIERDSF